MYVFAARNAQKRLPKKKKKAASTNDPLIWRQFKNARNETNNSMKQAKRKYFTDKLDASKCDLLQPKKK